MQTCLIDDVRHRLKLALRERNKKAASTDMFAYGAAVGKVEALSEIDSLIGGGSPELCIQAVEETMAQEGSFATNRERP